MSTVPTVLLLECSNQVWLVVPSGMLTWPKDRLEVVSRSLGLSNRVSDRRLPTPPPATLATATALPRCSVP